MKRIPLDDYEPNYRDNVKTIKHRVETLEAALRDIAWRTGGNNSLDADAVRLIHRIATQVLGEQ